ncbi:MAG: thioesterase family protein [Pseudomonadota bacterium]
MEFHHMVRVYFEDTDFTARVYHGAFVRFFERGRTEMLRAAGVSHSALANRPEPLWFALRKMSLEFLASARIDDLLTVRSIGGGRPKAAIAMNQEIWRDELLVARAAVELCLINGRGQPRRVPPDVADALAAWA